jgi:hypothetical protein
MTSRSERHNEAKLARDLGVEPTLDMPCKLRVRNGRIVGFFIGPSDMVEVLRMPEFKTWDHIGNQSAPESGFAGYIHGIAVFMLDEELP